MTLGILSQTAGSLTWIIKFFNSLFISLSLVYFFFFAVNFTKNSTKALFATIFLAMIPSYFTHFIWAHTLVTTFFMISLYLMEKSFEDNRWSYALALIIAAILLTQPSRPIKFAFMWMIFFFVTCLIKKKFLYKQIIPFGAGLLISLLWWFNKYQSILGERISSSDTVAKFSYLADKTGIFSTIQKLFPYNDGLQQEYIHLRISL